MTNISKIPNDSNNFLFDGKITPSVFVASRLSSEIIVLKYKSTNITFKRINISELQIDSNPVADANSAVETLNKIIGSFKSGCNGCISPNVLSELLAQVEQNTADIQALKCAFYKEFINKCTGSSPQPEPPKGLHIDPDFTAAYGYLYSGKTYTNIDTQAFNGVPPYVYTLTSIAPTTEIIPQTNNTGIFGNTNKDIEIGGTYNINVEDSCGNKFDLPITIADFNTMPLVKYDYLDSYGHPALNGICANFPIPLNAVFIGRNVPYNWTGPNGFTSTERNPRPIGVYPASSGIYSVTITPEGTFAPTTAIIKVEIMAAPGLPRTTNPTPTVAQNSGDVNVVTLSGVTGTILKWYDSETSTTPIAVPTAFPTDTAGTFVFYVTQTNSSGCESDRRKITLTVTPA